MKILPCLLFSLISPLAWLPLQAADSMPAPAEPPAIRLPGRWTGTLKPSPLAELRLALEVTDANSAKPVAVLISLDQGNARIPVTVLTLKDGAVHFETPSVGGSFDGQLNADGTELAGTWKQGPAATPLVLKKGEKTAAVRRPQEPTGPLPYGEEEVAIAGPVAGVSLAGTLTLPPGAGPWPAVVLITGSGPQDRNESLMGHRPFLVLADHLAREGIAVLRYDDRGVGKSTGSFGQATEADFIADAQAAVAFLKQRPAIDSQRIGLIGHSEGGWDPLESTCRHASLSIL